MDIKKANEILSRNMLDLSNAGMDYIPVKTVEIEVFEIMNKSKNGKDETAWYEKAVLIGMIRKNKENSCDFQCQSFMVKVHHDHHYCDFYSEAMEVIEALRVVNKWVSPYPDGSFTVTF